MRKQYDELKEKMKLLGLSLIPYEKIGNDEEIKLYLEKQKEMVEKIFYQKNVFPTRTHIGKDSNRRWIISYFGADTKKEFRELAKKTELYGTKIICPIYGSAAENNHIPINNVGKWLFGTPGYKGNIVFKEVPEINGRVEIIWSKDAPAIVEELIDKAILEWKKEFNC